MARIPYIKTLVIYKYKYYSHYPPRITDVSQQEDYSGRELDTYKWRKGRKIQYKIPRLLLLSDVAGCSKESKNVISTLIPALD